MKRKIKSPWLQIPAEDYEGHMSAPNVAQLQMLNKIFADMLNEFHPKSIAVLGCTIGNGFEHMVSKKMKRIVGVDINPDYISVCRKRFEKRLPQLELICTDLNEVDFPGSSFNLIHAALVFEYVDVELLVSKISHWLKPNGILSVVLQLPSETSGTVTKAPYESLKLLSPVMELINPENMRTIAEKIGLSELKNYKIKLQSGKSFSIIFIKNKKPVDVGF
jgi:SAM-dependent methyltransferase